ncbi:MAG: alpha/beta hydrolase [Burkholderiaceae bacterium]
MLDPQAKALLQLIEQTGLPPIWQLDPVSARRAYRESRGFSQPAAPEMALVRDLDAPGPLGPIPLRLYRPLGSAADTALPVLVYYHGGGFVIGDRDTHDVLCRQLSDQSGCAVVSVDYRMAPEHPFPTPVDECLAATRWIHAQAASLGLDASRLAVGGDSAGGSLASVVSLIARDSGDLPIRFQLLIYPGTDIRRSMPSHEENAKGYLLTIEALDYFVGHYISDPAHLDDWRASPILRQDLQGLPPALVLVAGYDPLRDEGLAYGQKLSEAGNRVSVVNFSRQIHGFITMGRVIDEANTAVSLCATVVRRALA